MSTDQPKAVVLSSGGIDSTTAMAIARDRGFAVYSLSFDYNQRHREELAAADRVARALGARRHLVLPVGLDKIGGSALTDDIAVPKTGLSGPDEIPVTYVPARNTIFLACALGWAEVIGAADIFIGVTAVDYSGYPDCRRPFIEAFEAMANLATRAGVTGRTRLTIQTPLLEMSKAEILRTGTALGIDYGLTLSCYDPLPGGLACGRCESCRLRQQGFETAGLADPTRYYRP
ncbi:MAG: 7-cyano-7-deazaguanine synthase QueC [Desulfosudaceae bacterium]